MIKFVVVDMDHTLADSEWRDHMIAHIPDGGGKRPEDFIEYNKLSSQDRPCEDVCWLVRMLKADLRTHMIVVTARPEMNEGITRQWLDKYEVPFDKLIMRPDEEFCPSPLFKTAAVIEYIKKVSPVEEGHPVRDHVTLVLDDRPDVIEAFSALGATTLQVRQGRRE